VRVLFLTHRLPFAPNRGDRIRAYHLLRVLSKHADVDLLSLVHDADEASHVGDLSPLATSVTAVAAPRLRNLVRSALFLPTSRPTTHTMLDAPDLETAIAACARRSPDVVLAYCSGMARCALFPTLKDRPLVLDMVDVDSAKWADMAAAAAFPLSRVYAREAKVLRAFEAIAARRASTTMVVTEKERRALSSIAPDARLTVVPNGVDARRLRPASSPGDEPVIIFCGVMDYAPNAAAVVWFVRKVWPLVLARRPDARFEIVGASPTPEVQALSDASRRVTVFGTVLDVAPHLWRAAVSIAPLQTARGVQNKVLEAVAAGLPTVVTPVVAEGIPEFVLRACAVAGSASAFAEAVVGYLELSPEQRRQLALSVDFEALSWDRTLEPVYDILAQASARD
jgi:sugar transferase (PEP-CTERM/EpsH1 system associated)